jgi:hypothetical protein
MAWPRFRYDSQSSGRETEQYKNTGFVTSEWKFKSSSVLSSAAVDNAGNIVFSTANGSVYSLSSIGSVNWRYSYLLNSSLYIASRFSNYPVHNNRPDASPTLDMNGYTFGSYNQT